MLRLIPCSYDRVILDDFMKVQNSSNTASAIPLLLQRIKPYCLLYRTLFNFGVRKGVKSFGKRLRYYFVYSKFALKASPVDK